MNALELHEFLIRHDSEILADKIPEAGKFPSASDPEIIPEPDISVARKNSSSTLWKWIFFAGVIIFVVYLEYTNMKKKRDQNFTDKDRKSATN